MSYTSSTWRDTFEWFTEPSEAVSVSFDGGVLGDLASSCELRKRVTSLAQKIEKGKQAALEEGKRKGKELVGW